MGSGGLNLALKDLAMSFMWVWAGVLNKMFVYRILGLKYHDPKADVITCSISITYMFFFAYLAKVSKGAAYNPLSLLSAAISGSFANFLFIVGVRIPAQVFGSIIGVKTILHPFPEIGRGPHLNVEVHHGALTEGLLTFAVVLISLSLSRNIPGSFYRKTWIASVSKLSLHILGSDLTGGCMNPASASDGVGLCTWRSHDERAYTCLLASSDGSHSLSRLGFQVIFTTDKAKRKYEEREIGLKDNRLHIVELLLSGYWKYRLL